MKKKSERSKKTKKQRKGWLFWTPRVLALLFIAFFIVMSFDAFDGVSAWYLQLAGFIIHLIPAFVLIAIYFVARKKPWIGGWIYVGIGVFFTFFFGQNDFLNGFLVALPIWVAGLLFLWSAKFLNKGNKHKKHG